MAADERIRIKSTCVDGSGNGPSIGCFVIFVFLEEFFADAFGHQGLVLRIFFVLINFGRPLILGKIFVHNKVEERVKLFLFHKIYL